jgi:hypothetical protein
MLESERGAVVEHHGEGDVKIGGKVFGSGPFRLQRQKFEADTPLSFEAFISVTNPRIFLSSFDMSFEGTVSLGGRINIPRLRNVSIHNGKPVRVRAQVQEIKLGFEPLPADPDIIELSAELTSTEVIPPRFAVETYADDGRIIGEFPSESQRIPTSLGTVVIEQSYHFESGAAGSSQNDTRIHHNTASLVLSRNCLSHDVEGVVDTFRAEVEDLCAVLGFLGRRRVEWYALTAIASWTDTEDERAHRSAEWYRTAAEQQERQSPSPIINPGVLPPDAFARMVSALHASPISSAIRLAIEYLNSSVSQAPLEARLVSAFTALEAIVSASTEAAGTAHTTSPAQFKKLGSRVRRVVRDFFQEKGLNPALAAEACDKVAEIYRRPIVPRTIEVLKQGQFDDQDLWPAGISIEEGLAASYRIRNHLVHAGKIEDREMAERARSRVHALTERLVYRLLEGEAEWVSPHAYLVSSRLQGTL